MSLQKLPIKIIVLTALLNNTIAGCSKPITPDRSRLKIGEVVYAFRDDYQGEEKFTTLYGSRIIKLNLGTKLTVAGDPHKNLDPMRMVTVHVDDGPFGGESGIIHRWDVRPAATAK